jgi:DNA-binding transcriptional LysR family regulator
MTPPSSRNYMLVAEAFKARGLEMPNVCLLTFSVHLRVNLLATGHFVSAFPRSFLHLYADRLPITPLPIDLPDRAWSVTLVTLKNRALDPAARLFVDYVRTVARSIAADMGKNRPVFRNR